MSNLHAVSLDTIDTGKLNIQITSSVDAFPLEGATISISYTGVPDTTFEQLITNQLGQTDTIELAAPPLEYSLDSESTKQPYAEYTLEIQAPGYNSLNISGTEILPSITAQQQIALLPIDTPFVATDTFVIDAHTLYGNYPAKIPEDEIKPITPSGEIVLPRVVIPEYIIVHDGSPTNASAKNYYVKYKDYIKNVASSEIYATWPTNTIYANVLAIMSFVLNRVYTEWYRNKGYDFTISTSTAYDQKWIPNRNIYDTISEVVDNIFTDYLSRPNVRQPIMTQYCDGKNVSCPNWLSQWGSKYLGDQGYTPIEILRYYYGDDMYINTAPEVSGVPSSWPGYTLQTGSSGDPVRTIQEQLNTIAKAYPLIPTVTTDGLYGPLTSESVRVFQSVFGLPKTGVVDYRTWYKISELFVGVSRIAELS
ncbi:MAG: peptidoglycan-binding protein [Eubacteriales bacterium]